MDVIPFVFPGIMVDPPAGSNVVRVDPYPAARGDHVGYHFCKHCNQWIEGFPGSAGILDKYRGGTLYTCTQCGKEIGFSHSVYSHLPEGFKKRRSYKRPYGIAEGTIPNVCAHMYHCVYCSGWVYGNPHYEMLRDERWGLRRACVVCKRELEFKVKQP